MKQNEGRNKGVRQHYEDTQEGKFARDLEMWQNQ